MAALEKRGVGFRSITEAIDTTTPGGRLLFHLFGKIGHFERYLIQERTCAGLAAVAAQGLTGGRKPVVTGDKLKRVQVLVAKGLTVREAAIRVKVGQDGVPSSDAQPMSEARTRFEKAVAELCAWAANTPGQFGESPF